MYLHGCKQTPATPPTTSDEDSSGSTDDGEMKKKKGNRAMGKKKYPKAVKYYSKAIKIDPENATYRLNRAIAKAALELWKDAEDDAAAALELGDPPSAKMYFQLARARMRTGKLDEAEETAKTGLTKFEEEAALMQLMKDIERRQKAAAEKKKQAAEALAARLANEGTDANKLEKAKGLLDRARNAYASAPDQSFELCISAKELLESIETAEAKREEISVCSLQGKVGMRLRKWPEACSAFERASKLGDEIYSMDNAEEREALANAYNNWGITLKNSGKLAEAERILNKAYAKATNGDDLVATTQVAQIVQNLAQCLLQAAKPAEARGMYARALEVGQRVFGGEHASLALNHVGIARCLKKEGQLLDAVRAYTTAWELWQKKDPQECLAEMPEVPNKERFDQIKQQVQKELAELILFIEEAKKQAGKGEGTGAPSGSEAATSAAA